MKANAIASSFKARLFGECGVREGSRLLAGCSGGLDSVCLLRIAAELKKAGLLDVSAGHVNHGLRREAAGDEAFVREEAKRLGVAFLSRRLNLSGAAGASVEAVAREARLAALREMAAEAGCDAIALAHHADDQAETVLMRLLTGSGLTGLAGMAWREGDFVRPLLDVRRAELEKLAKGAGWAWREDATNAEGRFLRNRIRNAALPELERILGREATGPILRSAKLMRADRDFLEALADIRYEELASRDGGSGVRVNRRDLLKESPAIAGRVMLRAVYEALGDSAIGGEAPRPGFDLIGGLLAAAKKGPGRETALFGLLHVIVEREFIRIAGIATERTADAFEGWPVSPLTPGVPLEVPALEASLCVKPAKATPETVRRMAGGNVAFIDAGRLAAGLSVRSWRRGDRFWPQGAPGVKKLSDFFTDCKIERSEKIKMPLVMDGPNIVWVGGLRIDHRYRVRLDSLKIFKIELKKMKSGNI